MASLLGERFDIIYWIDAHDLKICICACERVMKKGFVFEYESSFTYINKFWTQEELLNSPLYIFEPFTLTSNIHLLGSEMSSSCLTVLEVWR